MATSYARMRQINGTTAEWSANNIILGAGEIGIEQVSSIDVRVKVGDGVKTWSALPYVGGVSNTINAATQTALDGKVSITGSTMTGPLVLSGNATLALGAVPKQQLDAINTSLSSGIAGKLSITGGTMTGPITLSGAPTVALHAATKAYVDSVDAANVNKAGDTMTGALTLSGDPTAALHAVPKQYVDSGSYQTTVGGSATYAGKVVKLDSQGRIDTSMIPTTGAYRGTVDVTKPFALTGTYSVGDYFAVSTSGTIDATWATKINGAPTTTAAGQSLIYSSNGKYDLVGETSSAAAINSKVARAGDTMTGLLTLSGAPTAALHAATKAYADTKVALAGGTLTGLLTLAGAPTVALHAATKQYVDEAAAAAAAESVSRAGDTMTGLLTLSGAPTVALHAATKAYVDSTASSITTAYQSADNQITQAYQSAVAGRVNKAGDTMTGLLTLSGAPTVALHAATKAYVDTLDATSMKKSANLSDVASVATARANLDVDLAGTVSGVVTQTANYTLTAADRGDVIIMSVATANTLTIPTNASVPFPIGTRIEVVQGGAGQTKIAAVTGVTLLSAAGMVKISQQHAGITLLKTGADQWRIFGSLVA